MARGGWSQGPVDPDGPQFPARLPAMPQMPRGAFRTAAVIIAGLIVLFSTYYQVEPDEVGVVQRFGAYVRTTDPGPHLKFPFAETVVKVPVQRQLKMEFGFRTAGAAQRTEYAPDSAEVNAEAVMLTGDLNVAVVEWIVQYRIRDARAFLFHIRDVPATFRYMSEASMRQIIGD